jgi:hypothetical protein
MSKRLSLTALLERTLRQRPPDSVSDLLQVRGRSLAEMLVRRLVYQAIMGDAKAIHLIYDRLEGRVVDQPNQPSPPSIKVEWQLPLGLDDTNHGNGNHNQATTSTSRAGEGDQLQLPLPGG